MKVLGTAEWLDLSGDPSASSERLQQSDVLRCLAKVGEEVRKKLCALLGFKPDFIRVRLCMFCHDL